MNDETLTTFLARLHRTGLSVSFILEQGYEYAYAEGEEQGLAALSCMTRAALMLEQAAKSLGIHAEQLERLAKER